MGFRARVSSISKWFDSKRGVLISLLGVVIIFWKVLESDIRDTQRQQAGYMSLFETLF
jgi:hypothetical protein